MTLVVVTFFPFSDGTLGSLRISGRRDSGHRDNTLGVVAKPLVVAVATRPTNDMLGFVAKPLVVVVATHDLQSSHHTLSASDPLYDAGRCA